MKREVRMNNFNVCLCDSVVHMVYSLRVKQNDPGHMEFSRFSSSDRMTRMGFSLFLFMYNKWPLWLTLDMTEWPIRSYYLLYITEWPIKGIHLYTTGWPIWGIYVLTICAVTE